MRRLSFVIAIVVLALGTCAASAMELVMYRRAGCPWCAAWDREIGPIYAKTEIGRRLPIRSFDLDRGRDTVAQLKSPVIYTPTFVVLDDGREIGRIEGYPGQDFFWARLENLVPNEPTHAAGPVPAAPARPAEGTR